MSVNDYHNNKVDNLDDRYGRIRAELKTMDANEAIAVIEEFLINAPEYAEAHNDLGVIYYDKGNKLQTLGHYEKAVRLSPGNITFAKNLASFYFVEMGWVNEATRMYTDIMRLNPDDIDTLASLGIIAKTTNRLEEAGIFFGRILELEPWNEDARQAFLSVSSSSIPDIEPHCSPSSETRKDSDLDTIMADLRNVISHLEEARTPYQKACDLAENGQPEDAIATLLDIIDQEPDKGLIHNDLGVLYLQAGAMDESLKHHEAALSFSPSNPVFRKNLANLYFTIGKTDDAVEIFTGLLRENPNDTETLGSLAIISSSLNRREEACIFLRKISELEQDNVDARRLLHELQSSENQGFFLTSQ